jgi:hypothetical protein
LPLQVAGTDANARFFGGEHSDVAFGESKGEEACDEDAACACEEGGKDGGLEGESEGEERLGLVHRAGHRSRLVEGGQDAVGAGTA